MIVETQSYILSWRWQMIINNQNQTEMYLPECIVKYRMRLCLFLNGSYLSSALCYTPHTRLLKTAYRRLRNV